MSRSTGWWLGVVNKPFLMFVGCGWGRFLGGEARDDAPLALTSSATSRTLATAGPAFPVGCPHIVVARAHRGSQHLQRQLHLPCTCSQLYPAWLLYPVQE